MPNRKLTARKNENRNLKSGEISLDFKNKFPLVYIEWEDSVLGFQGWKLIDEQPHEKLTVFMSVGFLTYQSKGSITLYPHLEKCKDSHAGTGDIKIPRSAIRTMKTIKL